MGVAETGERIQTKAAWCLKDLGSLQGDTLCVKERG